MNDYWKSCLQNGERNDVNELSYLQDQWIGEGRLDSERAPPRTNGRVEDSSSHSWGT